MNPMAMLPLIAFFSTIILIFIMFTRARRSPAVILWFLILFFFLLWTIGEFAQKSLGHAPSIFQWAYLMTVHGDIFPAIFLVFALTYPLPNETFARHQYLFIILIVGSKVVSTLVTLAFGDYGPPKEWPEGHELTYGYYSYFLILHHQVSSIGGWYFYLGLAHTMFLLSASAFILVWNMIKSPVENVRHETRLVLLGFIIYLVIGASTGFIFPMMGIYPPELMSIGNLIFNIVVAYGILQGAVLLFSPTVERESTRDFAGQLQMGQFYLSSVDKGIETFTELVNHGYEGLYVGVVKPNLEITTFKRTPIVILTQAGKGLRQYGNLQYVPSDELKTFKASIFTFIQSATKGVIFLDNMDLILEKGWAPPKEFVEFGLQTRDARVANSMWLAGTPLKEDEKIEKVRSVMDFPVVKKAIVLEKLNRVLERVEYSKREFSEQLKRLGRVEPVFYYIELKDDRLVFNEDITFYVGALGMEPTNVIRLFIQQFQSKISPEDYKLILEDLREFGISRFEFLLRTGDSFLVEEAFTERGRAYDVFLDLMDKGFSGMCITRTEPNKLRQRHLLPRDADIYWLTQDRKEEKDIKPAPEYLMVHLKNHIDAHGDEPGIILLDGLEYLITFQGDQFDSYLKVMRRISDLISQSKLILLIPYDPEAIPADRIALFRRSGIEVITRDMLA